MAKEIIVNVGERETRIAVIEDTKLVELHIERAERVVGSLYKCRVANVLQGMDAAFVDIGLERNAFLYVGDVLPTSEDTGAAEPPTGNGHSRYARGRRPARRNGGVPSTLPAAEAEVVERIEEDEAAEEADDEAVALALDTADLTEEAAAVM